MNLKLKVIYTLLALQFTTSTYANSPREILCVLNEKDDVVEELRIYSDQVRVNDPELHSYHDKFKHCSVSCVLAKRCGSLSARALGFVKEFVDVFSSGNAELEDLVANSIGLSISEHVYSEQACFQMCESIFPVYILNP